MVLLEDLENISKNIKNLNINNCTILVTGSTGLIGSLLVKGFIIANKKYNLNNKVFALARDVNKAKNIFSDFKERELFIVRNEISEKITIDLNIDYIFHTACVTKSKEMVTYPVEVIKGSVCGTINILDFAKEHNVKKLIYLSSMEVFGVIDENDKRLTENDLGKIDLTSTRSCYPESKRINENICKCYFEEYGVNVCVARLAQTFGAGVNYDDNRIFAYIAKCIISGSNIELQSSGKSAHDYCYTTDAISALLILAKNGVNGEVYNIANENSYSSIYDMASLVVREFNKDCKVLIKNTDNPMFSKDSLIKLDTSKMRGLGWSPVYSLKEMYRRLINYYKETK